MSDSLFLTVLEATPNFLGFLLGLLILYRGLGYFAQENSKLIDIIANRDNCDDKKIPPTND